MTIVCLDARTLEPQHVREALSSTGCFQLVHPSLSTARWSSILDDARAFFALPIATKSEVAIEGSANFRGYSEMRNERDWREQIHFGVEAPVAGSEPPFMQLEGPNLWPPDPGWRRRTREYLADALAIGKGVLSAVALGLGLSADHFGQLVHDPYLLMKLICYHPQPKGVTNRPGVAPHVDFSWITVTLQDETGGLQVRRPDGVWLDVPPARGVLLVHLGELLEYVTGGFYLATPHRVVNPSSEAARLSIPVFINPNLRTKVSAFPSMPRPSSAVVRAGGEHVHRFLPRDVTTHAPFVFGEAEWLRKGLNVWCSSCVPPPLRAELGVR